MLDVVLMMCDETIDWADATLEPEHETPAQPGGAGPARAKFPRAAGARGAAASRGRGVPATAEAAARRWSGEALRMRNFNYDAFKPEMVFNVVEGTAGELISDKLRLVR